MNARKNRSMAEINESYIGLVIEDLIDEYGYSYEYSKYMVEKIKLREMLEQFPNEAGHLDTLEWAEEINDNHKQLQEA